MFDEYKTIATLAEVKSFANYLFSELHVNFHPDDDFNGYVDCRTHIRTFESGRAEMLNSRMSECFDVCASANADIYDMMDVITPHLESLRKDDIDIF